MDELDLEQSIEILLSRVPTPVRDYVLHNLSGEVRTLMEKYQLHLDQAGVLQKELLLMLLGQEEPAEFMKELSAAGIPSETVQSLMADINDNVFKPLRQKEQEAAMTPPPAPKPPKVEEPVAAPAPMARTMESDIRATAPPPETLPPYPQMPTGPQTQTYWVPVSITAVPQPYMTQQPPSFAAAPPPTPTPPSIPEPSKVEEHVAPPPAPTPPPPAPRAWEPPPPPPNLPTIEKSDIPIKKEYGADPYREPV